MLSYFFYIFTFLLGMSLALYLTPLVRQAAIKFGLLANPDGRLRTQSEAIPYLGGVAIYLAFLLAMSFSFEFTKPVMGLLLGGTVVLMVGLIDDFGVMTPWMKLFGQTVAVVALLKSGIVMELEIIPLWHFFGSLPVLHWLLSGFWLLAVANAYNFLDIEDGLAAGVAFFSCLALIGVAIINGRGDVATLTAALAGSTLGFLYFNKKPAKIYLGDAGSLFLGLMLGALAMIGSYTAHNDLGALCPAIILGVPCFEICLTTLARKLKGLPAMQGSRDHVVKRLKAAGMETGKAVLILWIASFILGMTSLVIMTVTLKISAIIVGSLTVIGLIAAILLLRIKVETIGQTQEDRMEEK